MTRHPGAILEAGEVFMQMLPAGGIESWLGSLDSVSLWD